MTEQSEKVPFLESTVAIVLAMIFFFPVGFFLLWRQPTWESNKKIKFAAAGCIWALVLMISPSSPVSAPASPETVETTTPDSSSNDAYIHQARRQALERTSTSAPDQWDRAKAASRSAGNGSSNDAGIKALEDARKSLGYD